MGLANFIIYRRHSFHDLDSVLLERRIPPQRLRIDVNLCGELLAQTRREEHLRNVASTLEVRRFVSRILQLDADV